MADSPPRDPKSAEGEAPAAAEAPSDARERMNSNLRYLLKQPSTPWITYDREAKPEGEADSLDAGWGEAGEERSSRPPSIAPPAALNEPPLPAPAARPAGAPPSPLAPALPAATSTATPPPAVAAPPAPATHAPAFDVPPPPAHMMAVVDQVLAQSRPPPADPGPANATPEERAELARQQLLEASRAGASPAATPSAELARPAETSSAAGAPLLGAPRIDLAPPLDDAPFSPIVAAPHPEDSAQIAPRKKTSPILFIALGVGALVVLAAGGVGILALRSSSSSSSPQGSAPLSEPASVVSASPANAPETAVTVASAPSSSPLPSASTPVANEAPIASVAQSAAPTPSAVAVAEPASSIDPKTGAKRASYLTIPRAVARHYVFLDGKLMLGTGPRSFPVKCGEHTLAIDDRKVTRVINVTCGGEYVVTN